MMPRGRAALVAGAVLLLFLWRSAAADRPGALVRYEASRLSMACVYSIVVYGFDAAALPGLVEAALDEVDRIDRLMSHYKPETPLSRLNQTAAEGPVPVDPELFDFIALCLKYSRDTEGAFDITVGPLMKAWGFLQGEGRIPGELEIADLRTRVGYEHVIVDAGAKAIRFDRPGIELDLGGIAKGYAVDRVVSLLKHGGIDAALVSAGGSTVYGLGTPPGAKGWRVALQDPVDPRKTALTVWLKDRALSVSGRSEKSFEISGVTYSHIMDPRTGRPVQGMLSVAVLSEGGTAGDALDDAFFVQGVAKSREYLKRRPVRSSVPKTDVLFFLPEPRRGFRMVRLSG